MRRRQIKKNVKKFDYVSASLGYHTEWEYPYIFLHPILPKDFICYASDKQLTEYYRCWDGFTLPYCIRNLNINLPSVIRSIIFQDLDHALIEHIKVKYGKQTDTAILRLYCEYNPDLTPDNFLIDSGERELL